MNGDSGDNISNNSGYLRSSSTLSTFSSNSPRFRRYEESKKSYLSSGLGSSTLTSSFSSKYSSSSSSIGSTSGPSYRLASLDRLAYRQKLYDNNGGAELTPVAPPTVPSTAVTSTSSFLHSNNVSLAGVNGTSNGTSSYEPSSLPSISTTDGKPNGVLSNGLNGNHTANGFGKPEEIPNHVSTATITALPQPLQTKREMFFKSDSTASAGGGGGGGGGNPLGPPSTAPPAPPVSAPTSAPPPPPTTTTANPTPTPVTNHVNSNATNNATNNATTNNAPDAKTSVASIKEQLLTTKDKKDHKDEENKESKQAAKPPIKDKTNAKEVFRRQREVEGYVGFANLPNQVYRKAVKKGFEFSLMVVGESGLGKSTMINSMFLSDIYSNEYPGPSHRVKKTVQVETTKVLLKENAVNLMLTVVDTPGFGDAVDNSDCWQPVIDYVESKYEEYLNAESKVNRKSISDNRVHCCLYFIAPSGHGLKSLDIEFMRRLHDKVNIIPVIAKADTLTPEECQHFKKQIINEIHQHKIKIYEFPEEDGDNNKLKQRVPFAVVGSNVTTEVDGKKVRGRKYPWGIVEVENLSHCDFIPLRNLLIRTHMQDLKEVTSSVHYENYRCRKLAGGTTDNKSKSSNKNPLALMEEEKKEHSSRMQKMESEMEQVFEMKVKEKMTKLSELEADLQKRNETMRRKLETDMAELEEERERFEKERRAWETANNVTVEELRRRSLESISKEQVDGKDKGKKKKGLF
ncbi:septin-7 isoform X3 [Hyalella azteca]|uniref:Septin-7 isoform X3 n=1 Tax=Hyalella azteca TaxID=294128 RepID=A0A8B7N823_HYAAZ|nr:septin-7 isoform X3 [Hyalella azteca]